MLYWFYLAEIFVACVSVLIKKRMSSISQLFIRIYVVNTWLAKVELLSIGSL